MRNIFILIKRNFQGILLMLLYAGMLLPGLGYSYVQPTDPVWVQRGIQFYEAFRHGDFVQTYTKYHPGVILMWITGISYKIFYAFQEIYLGYVRDLFLYQVDLYGMYSFIVKFFIGSVIGIVLFYCYSSIKKAFGQNIAFWAVFFIITEPFVLGNIRSIHVDALAAFFMFAAVLSFSLLQRYPSKSKKYVLLTGLFTGLALLTKISSLVLIPFFVVSFIISSLFLGKCKIVPRFVGILAVAVILFFILFPAMWVSPLGTIQKIISDGFLDTALNEESSRILFLSWDTVSFRYKYFSYFLQLIFRMSPGLLLLSVLGLYSLLKGKVFSKRVWKEEKILIFLVNSLVFLLGYYVMISISDKKIFRYILPMYPFLAILSAYATVTLVPSIKKRFRNFIFLFVSLLFVIQVLQPILVYPNFFAYFNPLLGGIDNASKVISLNQDATGYYIVGAYLNKKPTATDITVGCYDSGPMQAYFVGNTIKLKLTGLSEDYLENMDYILLPSQEGWQYLPEEGFSLEKIFRINNFDYWYLFRRDSFKIFSLIFLK